VQRAWSTRRLRTRRSITKREDVRRALREHGPKGVDVLLDNVGGEILERCVTRH